MNVPSGYGARNLGKGGGRGRGKSEDGQMRETRRKTLFLMIIMLIYARTSASKTMKTK